MDFSNDADATKTVFLESYPSNATTWTVTFRVNQNFGSGRTLQVSAYALCAP